MGRDASLDARVAGLAMLQHGLFTRVQLGELGATKGQIQHRLETARWEVIARAVYGVAGAPPSSHKALLAACFAWGPGATAARRSAGWVWRLAGYEQLLVELTVPRDRRRRDGPGVVARYRLSRPDVTVVQGIPVTTVARTLIDLAAVDHPERVEEALDDALRRGLVSPAQLRRRLDALGVQHQAGVKQMRALLDARSGAAPPGSVLERRVLRIIRAAGLPEPRLQYRVRERGRLVAAIDIAYPEQLLAIEADGFRWHSGRAPFERDRTRANTLTLLGWRIIHVTWSDLGRAEAVADRIRRALNPPAAR